MAYAWQTVEQAAVTLAVSTRTLARRIAKGEIESRLENGRREVFICLPEGEGDAATQRSQAPTASAAAGSPGIHGFYTEEPRAAALVNASSASVTPVISDAGEEHEAALVLAEDRARRAELAITVIQQSTALVHTEARRARSGARFAWATVALLAAGVMIAVAWTTSQVTRAAVEQEHLRERLAAMQQSQQDREQQLAAVRDAESRAMQAAARIEGQLAEVQQRATDARRDAERARLESALAREKQAAAPATQPSLLQRVAGLVFGE